MNRLMYFLGISNIFLIKHFLQYAYTLFERNQEIEYKINLKEKKPIR